MKEGDGKRPADSAVEITYIGRAASGRVNRVSVDWKGLEDEWTDRHGESYTSPDEVLERQRDYVKERLSKEMGVEIVGVDTGGVEVAPGSDVPEPGEATRNLELALEGAKTRTL